MFAARPSWQDAPAAVAAGVERLCRARIVSSRDVHGGMSPGPAAVLWLADGRRVFVKAVSRAASEPSHRFYQREAVALAALPAEAPAPVLLGSVEVEVGPDGRAGAERTATLASLGVECGVGIEAAGSVGAPGSAGDRGSVGGAGGLGVKGTGGFGDAGGVGAVGGVGVGVGGAGGVEGVRGAGCVEGAGGVGGTGDGWCALVMTVAEGVVAGPPWTDDGVGMVAEACEVIGSLRAPDVVPPIGQILTHLDGWELLAAGDASLLDAWEQQNLGALAELAAGWTRWTAGTALVHQDVRADNAVVDRAARRAVLVDWSFGCAGAPWLDRARLAADIVGAGHRDGPAAALRAALKVLDALPADAPRFVVALAGMWRYRSTLAAPPGLPTVRPWQRERARLVRPLLASLL